MVGMSSMMTYFNQLTLEKVKEHVFIPDEETSVSRIVFENHGSGTVSIQLKFRGTYTYLQFELRDNSWRGDDRPNEILFVLSGSWRGSLPDRSSQTFFMPFDEFRTCEEAFAKLCATFVERFQKPVSRGNQKVFFDTSEFIWCWKRPGNENVVEISGNYFYKPTCDGFARVYSSLTEYTEEMFSREEREQVVNGVHPTIIRHDGNWWLRSALVPVYVNAIPFNLPARHISSDETSRYEHVIVDGEIRYVDLRRTSAVLMDAAIHGYTTRIEQLIPADKLFLKGKSDLYSRRPQEETPFLGWELEACTNKGTAGREKSAKTFKEHMPFQVMCKSDASISPEGFEIVSVPATLDFWKESNLSSTLNSMRVSPYNMRSWEHSSCGFHVHVSRSALSVLDLQKLERFLHNPSNKDFVTRVAGRSSSTYAKFNPSMFSARATLSYKADSSFEISIGRGETIDELRYQASYQQAERKVRDFRRAYGLNQGPNNYVIGAFFSFMNQQLTFRSVDDVVLSSPHFQQFRETYPELVSQLGGNLTYYIYSHLWNGAGYSHLNNVDFVDFASKYFEAFCKHSYKFGLLVRKFFENSSVTLNINWNEVLIEAALSPTQSEVSWKAGLRKSKAKAGRRFSKAACDIIKGPVGKGVERYDVLNTKNVNTIEFRLFKGTMNPTSIMRYLEFTDALVRYVATASATDDGMYYQSFIKWLRGDAFNVARYEHLISFIVETGFIERKDIRKKELPSVVSADADVSGLTAVEPVGFEQDKPQPLGSFDTFSGFPTVTPSVMTEPMYDPEGVEAEITFDDDDDDDYYNDPDCDCDDCRAAREEY